MAQEQQDLPSRFISRIMSCDTGVRVLHIATINFAAVPCFNDDDDDDAAAAVVVS